MSKSKKTILKTTLSSSKRLTKKAYVWSGLITMAAVAVLVKPVKYGFGALRRRLEKVSQNRSLTLRQALQSNIQEQYLLSTKKMTHPSSRKKSKTV